MRNVYKLKLLLAALLSLSQSLDSIAQERPQQSQHPRKNWFNDPFFQVRAGIPRCPAPLGPMITEAERNAEAHYRVERGTSCWMEGKCSKPNSYLYDAPIADALRQRFAQIDDFDNTSLWLIVQRRFVTVQGCITRPEQAAAIEAAIKAAPDVERVILQVSPPPYEHPPYPLADAPE
jgi:hypothetical protein